MPTERATIQSRARAMDERLIGHSTTRERATTRRRARTRERADSPRGFIRRRRRDRRAARRRRDRGDGGARPAGEPRAAIEA